MKFTRGISVLETMGFHPVFSNDIFCENGYLAGPDTLRADMINHAFSDDQVNAIWCARGGYGAIRALGYLNYELISSYPKIFIGCSDMTSILNMLNLKCHMVSFHGPMIESLGAADDVTIQSLLNALCSNRRLIVSPQQSVVIHSGKSSGRVAGGNLTTLCHLIGTPFQPDFSGSILLIEDTGEAPYRIDRMLSQMKLAGCFKGLAGMVLGSFENCGEINQIYHIVRDIFSDMEIPILGGFDIGHGQPNVTIPLGVEAFLDADAGEMAYSYPHLDFNP
ncbi:MAG: LD-carboxypeptidase [Desulfobacterales bacterium]|nr:LD-carboxypeptidase [Desulfobacterales bacterium]